MGLLHMIFYIFLLTTVSCFILPVVQFLREGKEISTDVTHGLEQRFILHRRDRDEPLFIYVTPCGASVHWRLFSVDDDELMQLRKFESVGDLPHVRLIAGEEDDIRMKFFARHIDAEQLVLVLTASSPASARIFFSTSQEAMDDMYPPLPKDTRLAYAVDQSDSDLKQALVTFKVADIVKDASDPLRYRTCAIVSRRFPDWAVCDLLDEGLESIHCTPSHNNSVIIRNIRSGFKYYITVFIRDSNRGTTSSYSTLEVNLKKKGVEEARLPRKEEVRLLPDSNLKIADLSAKEDASLSYFYAVPHNKTRTQRVLLIAHSCNGMVRMNIYRNGKLLRTTEPFSGFRRFLVINVRRGQLRFEIVNEDNKPKSVRLWASTSAHKSPYPMLPEDTSVKVVRRTCTTATLQWLRSSDTRAEYCIYKRKENAHFLEHIVSKIKADNLCETQIQSELVGCYQHKGPQTNNAAGDTIGVIETTISDLHPSATYRFDLLATPLRRKNSQQLPYRTVWVRTIPC